MRAAQSRLVVNGVTLNIFVEVRVKLFGAEIFNYFSVAVVPEPGWKLRIRAMYKPRQVVIHKCLSVLVHFGFY